MPQNLFKIYDGRNNFYQWDTGQKLIVLDDTIDQVHFSTKDMTHALISEVHLNNDGVRVCSIPDIILTLPKNLVAYAYILDSDKTRTVRSVKFPVIPRPIPDNYISNQNDEIEDLVNRVMLLEDMLGNVEVSIDDKIAQAVAVIMDNPDETMNSINELVAWVQEHSAKAPKMTTITLLADAWVGDASPYSQVVSVNGVTENSKIDLQPDAIQIVELQDAEISLTTENDAGVVTVWAIGEKPSEDMTVQALIQEVTMV